jgi:hypothetical protein
VNPAGVAARLARLEFWLRGKPEVRVRLNTPWRQPAVPVRDVEAKAAVPRRVKRKAPK